ncbi:hypothetical protein [Mangrovihabitans endophyticus]|uniref:hypothetical protein n=1 Tax=Mangrovihabitans endophyticus TaxID=1751298 RepID=UPI00166306C7|nr:hypothetical protein [Mangrovihabitans endophyticus]
MQTVNLLTASRFRRKSYPWVVMRRLLVNGFAALIGYPALAATIAKWAKYLWMLAGMPVDLLFRGVFGGY